MNKDLKDIQEQKDLLVAGMRNVPIDGKAYKEMLKRYNTLVKTEELIKDGKKKRGPLEILLKIGGFVVTAAGVIFVPQLLADKAYQNNQDMRLMDGQIWNLIGKNFGPRDNNKTSA